MAEGFICRRGGGGGSGKSEIIVTAPTGSTVTATCGTTVKTAAEKAGQWIFKNCDIGTWAIKATLSGKTASKNVEIKEDGQLMRYYIRISYRLTADSFEYCLDKNCSKTAKKSTDGTGDTGDYAIVFDTDENWRVKVFTTLYAKALQDGYVDVFCVGGGGAGGWGGGGSGYTSTKRNVQIIAGTVYQIVIGAGAVEIGGPEGGKTSAFGVSASGGKSATAEGEGADGGSGGGAARHDAGPSEMRGGSDGSDGDDYLPDAGIGQHTTTKEFAESNGDLYAGAGGGASQKWNGPGGSGGGGDGGYEKGEDGRPNTGGGGGGCYTDSGTVGCGGSGIVVFRENRGETA